MPCQRQANSRCGQAACAMLAKAVGKVRRERGGKGMIRGMQVGFEVLGVVYGC